MPQMELVSRASQWLSSQRDSMEKLVRDLVEVSSWTGDKAGNDTASAVLRKATPGTLEAISSAKYGDHSVFHGARKASDGGTFPMTLARSTSQSCLTIRKSAMPRSASWVMIPDESPYVVFLSFGNPF